jgi:hypothetical protein
MTSISVSQNLWETLTSKKPRKNTMDEFLTRLVEGYYYLKENYTFVEDAYAKAAQKNEDCYRIIENLQSKLNNISPGLGNIEMVEPARGVAAVPPGIQSTTNKIEGGEFKTVEQW